MGISYRPGRAIVVPELTRHVADRKHQESQILKEKRTQQEMKGGKGKKDAPPKPGKQWGGGRGGSVCPAARRRIHKGNYDTKRVNAAITSLNSLFFGSASTAGALVTWPTCQTANVIC